MNNEDLLAIFGAGVAGIAGIALGVVAAMLIGVIIFGPAAVAYFALTGAISLELGIWILVIAYYILVIGA